MLVQGPFLPPAKAAKYCGQSEDTFRKWMKIFDIPLCGPGKNVIAASTLDAFMADPGRFLPDEKRPPCFRAKAVPPFDPAEFKRENLDRKQRGGVHAASCPPTKKTAANAGTSPTA